MGRQQTLFNKPEYFLEPLTAPSWIPHYFNTRGRLKTTALYVFMCCISVCQLKNIYVNCLVWALNIELLLACSWCLILRRTEAYYFLILGFPGGSDSKGSACNPGDLGLIPGLGRSPGEGERIPTQVFWPGESSTGSQKDGHDWATFTSLSLRVIRRASRWC